MRAEMKNLRADSNRKDPPVEGKNFASFLRTSTSRRPSGSLFPAQTP
jgi:hypothetical protein